MIPDPDGDAVVVDREFFGHDQLITVTLPGGIVLRARSGPGTVVAPDQRGPDETRDEARLFLSARHQGALDAGGTVRRGGPRSLEREEERVGGRQQDVRAVRPTEARGVQVVGGRLEAAQIRE